MNLTQLLVTQDNVDEISTRFGLTEEQTLEAMAAVIPAFSEGLKRQTGTPQNAARFIEALASGRHAQYANDPGSAIGEGGMQEGNAILGHLFGNKQVSRAVAKQAAAETGISDRMFKNLLPAMASMVMGSLFKGATNNNVAPAAPSSAGGLGDLLGDALSGGDNGDNGDETARDSGGGGILGQIIEGLAGGLLAGAGSATKRRRSPTRRRRTQQPGSLEDLLGNILGGGTTRKRRRSKTTSSRSKPAPRRRRRSSGGNTNSGGGMLDGLLDEFLGGGNTQSRSRRQPPNTTPMPSPRRRTRRAPPADQSTGGGLGDIFGDFLEPGGNSSAKQRRQTGSIFDEFLEG